MGCNFSKLSHGGAVDKTKTTAVDECDTEQLVSACRAVPELGPLGALLKARETAFISNNPKLQSLAEEHFESTVSAAALLSSLALRLSKARACRSLGLEAVRRYYEEAERGCMKKLEEFREAAWDGAFADTLEEFDIDSVCERRRSMYRAAGLAKDEAEEKLISTDQWRKLWRTATYSVAALAASSSSSSSPCVAVVACTVATMTDRWMESMWGRRRLDALAAEEDVLAAIWRGRFDVHELESVRAIAKRLEILMGSVSLAADFALRWEDDAAAVAMAMEEVERKMGAVGENMKGMEMKVDSCFNEMRETVTQLLNIIKGTY